MPCSLIAYTIYIYTVIKQNTSTGIQIWWLSLELKVFKHTPLLKQQISSGQNQRDSMLDILPDNDILKVSKKQENKEAHPYVLIFVSVYNISNYYYRKFWKILCDRTYCREMSWNKELTWFGPSSILKLHTTCHAL